MPLSVLLKLVVTPILIAGASLIGRRWGEALSGWLVGVPFTSGPIVLFLAIDHGVRFAATAALGVVLGVTSQAVFALAYVRLGGRRHWLLGLAAGTLAYAAITIFFTGVRVTAALEPVLVVASLLVAIALVPPTDRRRISVQPLNDLPVRMVVVTALVLGLTAMAPLLGPSLTGLLSPFPLYAAILAVFAHRHGGVGAAAAVWRGLLFGLFGFLAFFTVLAALMVSLGIAAAFGLAIAAGLAIQGATLFAMSLNGRRASTLP